MAVPGSGTLSLGQIRQELQTANYAGGVYTAAATSLDAAENGSITTINKCSALYPLSANPASMSEWYGYDHDAPCKFATASFYFDGGNDNTDELVTSNKLSSSPADNLKADFQDQWTLSMWVKIHRTFPAVDGDPGYQRGYGLWWIDDRDNGYLAGIHFIPPVTSPSGNNVLDLVIAAGSGSNNFRQWEVVIDDPANNQNITQINDNSNWSTNNPGATNSNEFTHLVFVYDDTQGATIDKFTIYWNGERLTTTNYNTGAGGSGPSGIPYTGNQYAHFGIGPYYGIVSPYTAPWYGWIGWMSFANRYAADQGAVDTLYNGGTTPPQVDITGLDPNMILYEFGANTTPQYDYNGNFIGLDVVTAEWSNTVYP